jgi:RES domain/TIR domain
VPPTLPPGELPGTPTRYVLPAGTALWRVHRSGLRVDEFDSARGANGVGGGRFDSVGHGGYPYLYCSPDAGTALAERFVGNLDFTATATRRLRRKEFEKNSASVCRTTTELNLLSLRTGPDLAAVGQDGWLLSARGKDFDLTRRWAAWLRERARWAQGFVWQSGVDMPKPTMVLFGDACESWALDPVDGMDHKLDDPDRQSWLRYHLNPHGVEFDAPAPPVKPRFFINYRSDNGGLAAGLLDRELTRRLGDAAVFRDRRSIRPATDFPPEILDKVRGCRTLLVVVCPGWENTRLRDGGRRLDDPEDWVRKEIREAASYQVPIVPVLVGTRSSLAAEDLPEDIRFLADRQYLHLRAGFDERDIEIAVDELLQ